MYVLIEYDVSRSERVFTRTFPDTDYKAAMDARLDLELDLHRRKIPNREVVVLQADSMDTLKVTHGRYFKSLEEIFGDLVNAIASR